MREWTDLQKRVYDWQLRNFGVKYPGGNSPHWTQVAGIVEELGELVEAEGHEAEDDAICDATVYSMSLAASFGWTFGSLMSEAVEIGYHPTFVRHHRAPESVMAPLGQLSRCVLKRDQGIRGYDVDAYYQEKVRASLVLILAHIALWVRIHRHGPAATASIAPATSTGQAYYLAKMHEVIAEVTRRDWITNPTNAHIKENLTQEPTTDEMVADIEKSVSKVLNEEPTTTEFKLTPVDQS